MGFIAMASTGMALHVPMHNTQTHVYVVGQQTCRWKSGQLEASSAMPANMSATIPASMSARMPESLHTCLHACLAVCMHVYCNNCIGHNYTGHNCLGHNCMGHNYIGHNYIGPNHNRLRTTGFTRSRVRAATSENGTSRFSRSGHVPALVETLPPDDLYSYGPYGYAPYGYGLRVYGLYSYGLFWSNLKKKGQGLDGL